MSFVLVIFKSGKPRAKKCSNQPTKSSALWRLGGGPQLLPGQGGEAPRSVPAAMPGQARWGGGEKCLTFLCVCLVIDSGNRSVSLSW